MPFAVVMCVGRWVWAMLAVALAATSAQAQRRPSRPSRGAPLHAPRTTPPPDPDSVAAAQADDDEPGPFYGALDFSAGQSLVRFATVQEISDICMPEFPCKLPGFDYTTLTGIAAFGYRSFALEGGVSVGVAPRELPPYFVVRAGVRVESGWRSIFSVMFRFQWLYRLGDFEGMGASASVGLVVRPVQFLALFGEVACDVLAVPPWASQVGGVLAYTPFFVGGMRFQFGH